MDLIQQIVDNWWHMPVIIAMTLAYAFLANAILFKPIQGVMQRRRDKSREASSLSEQSRDELNKKFAEYEHSVLEARRKGTQIKEKARNEAMEHRSSLLSKVREGVEEEFRKTETTLSSEIETAKAELEKSIPALARQVTQKILHREVAA
jgi:F-type H+-transporting ATPase subunit b